MPANSFAWTYTTVKMHGLQIARHKNRQISAYCRFTLSIPPIWRRVTTMTWMAPLPPCT